MKKSNRGQTIILLLVFMIVALMVTTASVISMSVNIRATEKVQEGTHAFDLAESGAENAMVKLLRDINYAGETLALPQGNVEITVTGTNPQLVRSTSTVGDFQRTIEVTVDTANNTLTVLSWKEVI